MDTTMTLVDALIVASIFLPFVILNRIGNRTKRKLSKHLKQLAEKNGLNLSEKEFWANSYIGIDSAKRILLFIRAESDTFEDKLIDLKNVKECKIATSVKNLKVNNRKQHILEKVDLQLYFTINGKAMESINFYDHNLIFSEDLEVNRAEKWKKLIEEVTSISSMSEVPV